jgi:hypothetical protein
MTGRRRHGPQVEYDTQPVIMDQTEVNQELKELEEIDQREAETLAEDLTFYQEDQVGTAVCRASPATLDCICMYRLCEDLAPVPTPPTLPNSAPPPGGMFGSAGVPTCAEYTGDGLTGRLWNTTSCLTVAPLTHTDQVTNLEEEAATAKPPPGPPPPRGELLGADGQYRKQYRAEEKGAVAALRQLNRGGANAASSTSRESRESHARRASLGRRSGEQDRRRSAGDTRPDARSPSRSSSSSSSSRRTPPPLRAVRAPPPPRRAVVVGVRDAAMHAVPALRASSSFLPPPPLLPPPSPPPPPP